MNATRGQAMSPLRPRAVLWLRRLGVAAGLLMAVMVAWQVRASLDAPIRSVTVLGEMTLAERERASELILMHLPAGWLSLDLDAVSTRLRDESWVRSAAAQRRWPDGLEVRLEPEVAVARWRDDALLSSSGSVIEPLEFVERASLPRLGGPAGSERRVMELFQLVNELARTRGMKVVDFAQDDSGEVRLTTASEIEIALGDSRHGERMRRALLVIDRGLQGRVEDIASVDARYDNGVAIAWREASTESASAPRIASNLIEGRQEPWPVPNHR